MRYLLLFALFVAACAPIRDTPALRAHYDTAVDVLPVPDKPRDAGGMLRITVLTPTPTKASAP